MASNKRRVRYAVVGAGNIAQVAVLPAFHHARKNSELVAVISGDDTKRGALRKRYELELDGSYDELESILERGRIDAVYIATPNSLHKEHAIRAAASGVHVLCEKPLAPSVADCRAMDEACDENGVKLMVAYRLHFDEATLAAIEVARSGRLGELRLFTSTFSHVVRQGDIRTKPELGGGATYDLGVYCINAARNLFGAEPTSVVASAIDKDGTDDVVAAALRFTDDRIAQFCVSNSASSVSSYRISGTKGSLRMEPAYDYSKPLVSHLSVEDHEKRRTFAKRDQFAPEILYFSQCILEDSEPEPSAEEGLCDVRVVEAILASARSGAPVELEPFERRTRPTRAQQFKIPPVGKQEPVHASGPSER